MQPHNHLLDIAAFLSVIEPKAKQKFASIKLEHDQIFDRAIASLRKQHQLRQSDIIGVSERQVRRIEQGEGTKVETLNLFAQAHKMELNDYLDAVAGLIDNTSVDLDSFTHPNIPEIDDLFKLMGTENPVEVIEKKVNSEYISREECN